MRLTRVLLTCGGDSPASAKGIRKNGDALEPEVDEAGTIVQRYRIDLQTALSVYFSAAA